MKCDTQKLLTLAVLFFVVAHPKVYAEVDKLVKSGGVTLNADGKVALHALVYAVLACYVVGKVPKMM